MVSVDRGDPEDMASTSRKTRKAAPPVLVWTFLLALLVLAGWGGVRLLTPPTTGPAPRTETPARAPAPSPGAEAPTATSPAPAASLTSPTGTSGPGAPAASKPGNRATIPAGMPPADTGEEPLAINEAVVVTVDVDFGAPP